MPDRDVRDADTMRSRLESFGESMLEERSGSCALVAPDGLVFAANEAWRAYVRHDAGDPLIAGVGSNYLDVCRQASAAGEANAPDVLAGLLDVLSGVSADFTITYEFHGGDQPRWVRLTVQAFSGPAGGAILSHVDATTERLAHHAIAATGTWSDAVVRESADLISVNEADGTVRWISPSVERLLGWTVEDLTGTNSFALVHPDDIVALASRNEGDVATSGDAAPVVFRMRAKDTSYRYVEATLTNLIDDPTIHGLVVHARDVTERVVFDAELTRLATTDALTGLANRAALLNELAQLLSQPAGAETAVAFIDLDRFRVVNDSLGHRGGDDLLVQVGERLTGLLLAGELLARFGGDEFVVILGDEEPAACVARLLSAFDSPFRIGETVTTFSASIGVAHRMAAPAVDSPEDLLGRADAAMFAAKQDPATRWRAFDETLREEAVRHVRLAEELRTALLEGRIQPDFQPVYSLADGTLLGVEALARWHRLDGSVWLPALFLDVCERSGQLVELGRQILDQACQQVAAWQISPRPWLAVNVSAQQLVSSDFPDLVAMTIERHGLAPGSLQLEVVESYLVDDVFAPAVLGRLEALGIALSIDDFGTGWSSLSRLASMPVSTLKIDRRFVATSDTNATSRAIVSSVTALARGLAMASVAEGVETASQLASVKALGADAVQGFLTGRPGTLDAVRPIASEIATG
jgi:diguanylate cyclase (GGDEF)-like protein/PAS domain S-box-containing protein